MANREPAAVAVATPIDRMDFGRVFHRQDLRVEAVFGLETAAASVRALPGVSSPADDMRQAGTAMV